MWPVGDLTVRKSEIVEFLETETVESATRAVGDSTEGVIAVWTERGTERERWREKILINKVLADEQWIGNIAYSLFTVKEKKVKEANLLEREREKKKKKKRAKTIWLFWLK